jgi:hypothetical protein
LAVLGGTRLGGRFFGSLSAFGHETLSGFAVKRVDVQIASFGFYVQMTHRDLTKCFVKLFVAWIAHDNHLGELPARINTVHPHYRRVPPGKQEKSRPPPVQPCLAADDPGGVRPAVDRVCRQDVPGELGSLLRHPPSGRGPGIPGPDTGRRGLLEPAAAADLPPNRSDGDALRLAVPCLDNEHFRVPFRLGGLPLQLVDDLQRFGGLELSAVGPRLFAAVEAEAETVAAVGLLGGDDRPDPPPAVLDFPAFVPMAEFEN